MKNNRNILWLLAMCFTFLTTTVSAQNQWLDKASSLLKKQNAVSTSVQPGQTEIADAFRQALRFGSETVVTKLGVQDGFNKDPAIHIPLPAQLNTVKTMLGKVGMSGMVSDLELKLNRAAEAATPKAKQLFLNSISQMSFADVKTIYDGPADSATQYFKGKMTPALSAEMRPIIDNSLSEVGAVQSYDKLMGSYKALPFVPDVKANLSEHVVTKAMDGIFYYLAKEEADIRANPAKQTTELLKKVFGMNSKKQ